MYICIYIYKLGPWGGRFREGLSQDVCVPLGLASVRFLGSPYVPCPPVILESLRA